MSKPIILETTIPFSGFYGSIWDSELDENANRHVEWELDESNDYSDEMKQPVELRLDESTLHKILFDVTNYQAASVAVAKGYVDVFRYQLKDEYQLDLKSLKFEVLDSPREYNFSTDRIFCKISLADVKRLFAISMANDHDVLRDTIKGRFTSYDGFISSYSNEVSEFLRKPLRQWDHNEVGTLLLAVIEIVMTQAGDDPKDLEMNIYQDYPDGLSQEWESAVDWKVYEQKRCERRELLVQDLKFNDPGYVAPLPLCPQTLDLFGDTHHDY
jgi:hypothetical protein